MAVTIGFPSQSSLIIAVGLLSGAWSRFWRSVTPTRKLSSSITPRPMGRWTSWSSSWTAAQWSTTMRTSDLRRRRIRPSDEQRASGCYAESGRFAAAELHPGAGGRGQMDRKDRTVCGKVADDRASFDLPDKPLVDSTGIYFTPMLRHLDRGSQEVDNGHYLSTSLFSAPPPRRPCIAAR
jgi:hypothetical protein